MLSQKEAAYEGSSLGFGPRPQSQTCIMVYLSWLISEPWKRSERCSVLCVSLPHRYGQLSGMVEPLAGLLGAVAVVLAEPLLPYALAFAAGAMVYVVVDDIIPEAQVRWAAAQWKRSKTADAHTPLTVCVFLYSGNGKLASWMSILGFIVMMSLDVGLGWAFSLAESSNVSWLHWKKWPKQPFFWVDRFIDQWNVFLLNVFYLIFLLFYLFYMEACFCHWLKIKKVIATFYLKILIFFYYFFEKKSQNCKI